MSEGNGTIRKTVDEHLSLVLPSGVVTENKTTEQGQKQLHIIFDKGTGSEFKLVVQSAGKEAELEEAKRNLKGRFHTHVEAKLGETQGLFGISQYFNVMVLTEHQRHPYVFAAYQGVSDREDLTTFANRAASYLNSTLAGASIDGYSAELEPMTGGQFLELAGIDKPMSEEEAQKEYLERLQKNGGLNGGVSFQVTRRNPITGRIERDLFWERAGAESGDPEAMGKLALAYLNGDGVEKDEKKALEYMRKAADAGNATAQYNMGIFYFQGQILKKDLDQAQKWMEKAARSGDPDAYGVLNAIRSQKAEEDRRKAEEAKRKSQERQQREQAEHEKRKKEILTKRSVELALIMKTKKEEREKEIQKKLDDAVRDAEVKKTESEKRIAETEKAISELGFLKFKEKSRLKGILTEAQNEKVKAVQSAADAKSEYQHAMLSLDNSLSEERRKQELELARRYPLPKRAYNAGTYSYGTPKQIENNGFKSDIISWMQPGVSYTIAEICEGVPSVEASGISGNRVTALMTQLKDEGWVSRKEEYGRIVYSLID